MDGGGEAVLAGQQRQYFDGYAAQTLGEFHYGLEQVLDYARAHDAEYDTVVFPADPHTAYIYVLFYERWAPSDVHRRLEVQRSPPQLNSAVSLGKYRFQGTEPDPRELAVVFSFPDPAGRNAWRIYAGQSREWGRLLWLASPS